MSQHLIHRRHRCEDGGFFPLDQPQHLLRVEPFEQHGGSAHDHLRQGVDEQPADVEHRKHVQIHLVAAHVVNDRVQAVPGDLAMADLRALGQTGGAAGEDDGGDVLLDQHLARAGFGQSGVEQIAKVQAAGDAGAVEMNPVANRGFLLRQQGDAVLEGIIVDQHGWGDFGQNLLQLAPVQPPVQRGMNRPQLAAGEEDVQVLNPIQRQHRHPVALADAGGVAQPVRQPVGPFVQLGETEPQFRIFACVYNRQRLRAVDRAPAEIIADVHSILFLMAVTRLPV